MTLFPVLLIFACLVHDVTPECKMTDAVCEFWLVIEHQLTMMYDKTAVFPANGKLYAYNVTNTTDAAEMTVQPIISADGWEMPRLLISVNKTLPGPALVVNIQIIFFLRILKNLIFFKKTNKKKLVKQRRPPTPNSHTFE